MKSIPTSPAPDKVILIHNGALGDFLLIWPSAWAIGKAFSGAELYWAGAAGRMAFLEPLGLKPCPPRQRQALERLYGSTRWPEELAGYACVWFVVERLPDAPAHENLWFARAIRGGQAHARDSYLADLAKRGVPPALGWLDGFRRLFAAGRQPSRTVLLFPGAGHPLKQWPLVQFFRLADMLKVQGLEPLFVLGPAELERGLVAAGRPHAAPASLDELTSLLLGARAVIGPDTGPLHLAGMLGVPGVALFGPTDPAVWGPIGIRRMRLGLPCSPCTMACADLNCPRPLCLETITPESVLAELNLALAGA